MGGDWKGGRKGGKRIESAREREGEGWRERDERKKSREDRQRR